MVVKCLQSTYSLKIRGVVYPASTCQKDYSYWDYVYVVVCRGLWRSHLPLAFICWACYTNTFKKKNYTQLVALAV